MRSTVLPTFLNLLKWIMLRRILSQGKHVTYWLNGEKTVEFDRGSDDFRARVAASKYHNIPNFGEWADGHILLQDHGNEASFRNVKIHELPAK